MEEQTKSQKRRERIKTLLIIFLAILLVLTFFSNTILNYSLPTVSAQYAGYGTITEKIRGSGTVTANQNYEVSADGKKTVSQVYIKVGDEVKTGDKLFALDAEDNSEAIKEAESALQEAEIAYQKALLTAAPSYTAENQEINNARADLQTAINRLNAAKSQRPAVSESSYQIAMSNAKNAASDIEKLTSYISIVSSGETDGLPAQYAADLLTAQNAVQAAARRLETAQAVLEAKTITVSSAEQEQTVLSLEREAEKAQVAYDRAKADYEFALQNGVNTDDAENPVSVTDLQRAMEDAAQTLRYAQEDAQNARTVLTSIQAQEQALVDAQNAVTQAQNEQSDAQNAYKSACANVISKIQADLDAANALAESAQSVISAYESQDNSISDVSSLEDAVSQQERALQNLLVGLAEKKEEDSLAQQINKLDLQSQQNAIDKQKAEIEKLKKEKDTQIITSKNDGIVNQLNCAAGDSVMDGDSLASITLTGSGYTVQIPVTAEQARKLHTGMNAEITNQYYSDMTATLTAIKQDTEKAGSDSKNLIFSITGNDVTPGQLLALSIQTSSENYDCVVPSSAVMEDNKGKFVLVVTAKNTPLGNRYYVSRSDVQVISHDDTSSAVQGNVSSSDFVVTASETPLTAGMQVRMEENS